MQIISNPLDYLRVFANVIILVIVFNNVSGYYKSSKYIMLGWIAVSVAIIMIFLVGLI